MNIQGCTNPSTQEYSGIKLWLNPKLWILIAKKIKKALKMKIEAAKYPSLINAKFTRTSHPQGV